jgi:hypothetical protein
MHVYTLDVTTVWSRNVGNHLLSDAASHPRRTDTVATPLPKPKNWQPKGALRYFLCTYELCVINLLLAINDRHGDSFRLLIIVVQRSV